MVNNNFLKVLSSIPIILVFLYYIPFLGVCLLLLRLFTYYGKRKRQTPIILIIFGILILVPKLLNTLFSLIKFDSSVIPYFDNIVNSDLYSTNFIGFSKTLIIIGVLYLIINTIFSSLYSKINSKVSTGIRNYINESEKKDYEIRKENDLKMQEKREKALNTHVVKCPYCGSDNMLTEKVGTCKFCRRKIEYK